MPRIPRHVLTRRRPLRLSALRQVGARALSILLIVALLAVQTPAAPQVMAGVATGWGTSFAFWYEASGWADMLRRVAAGQNERAGAERQERQAERNARVTRIAITPADVTVRLGERIRFIATAFDADDVPVSGIKFRWRAEGTGRAKRVHISRTGEFEARVASTIKVTADGAGQRAETTLTVEGARWRPAPGEQPIKVREVSTRAQSPAAPPERESRRERVTPPAAALRARRDGAAFVKASLGKGSYRRAVSAAPSPALLPLDEPYWNDTNYMTADDPGNEVGDPPGSPIDDGAGSGNFQMAAPVIALAGRGLDLALGLSYNSRVWHKAGSEITFDMDKGSPAPGWSLGFGKLVDMGVDNGSMLVDADGTRHGYTGQATIYTASSYFSGHTTDGTFIDYTSSTSGTERRLYFGQARYPNGTLVEYGAAGQGAVYPTSIKDANGNLITVTYRNNAGPQIDRITDTLGRTVQFHYDANNLLVSVTAPDLQGQRIRTVVRLDYRQITLGYSFYGLTPRVASNTVTVLKAIYYPTVQTGYWFGDADSYSSYGMIARVREQRGMSYIDGSGISPGTTTREQAYSYPLSTSDVRGSNLTDAPTYDRLTETWDTGWGTMQSAETLYNIQQNATPRRTEITRPDGSRSVQFAYNMSSLAESDPEKYKDGLVYRDETYDRDGRFISSSDVAWERGAYESPRPVRTVIADGEIGQTTGAEFSYGAVYNQVTEARDYGYGYSPGAGNTPLRITRTEYENGFSYTNNHIFNLVKATEVFAPDGVTRLSRIEYRYDEGELADAPDVTQHADTHNPYAPTWTEPCECEYVYNEAGYWEYICHSECQRSDYDPATNYRGLVTSVKTFADAANLAGAITETRAYDMTGNLRTASTACCEQTSVSYTVDTQYAYPSAQTRGSATDAAQQVRSSAVYDFYTGVMLSATDANGRTSQSSYDLESLRVRRTTAPTGAYTAFDYDDAGMSVTEETRDANNVTASKSVRYLNGLGAIRLEEALAEGGVWDVVETEYDNFGRVKRQTRPYRKGVAADRKQWSVTEYDALGRTWKVTAPDLSESKVFYNRASDRPDAASGEAGQTTLTEDAWGRQRWGRTDAQGRLVEVVEPHPGGNGAVATGGLRTTYVYDTPGNLVEVTQGEQRRRFAYDSLGRLTRQKLAETQATLDAAGNLVGGGQWSDAFAYDERSNLTVRTDARGVRTTFSYNNDPLNRLHSVSYTAPAGANIAAAATVSYEYNPVTVAGAALGDKTLVSRVTAVGVSTEEYRYDAEGRLAAQTLVMAGRESYPLATSYLYDTLDRVRQTIYPQQYGTANPAARKTVEHSFDVASRLAGLRVDSAEYASGLVYNPSSQTTEVRVGAGGATQTTERYEYDEATGLLDRQRVIRGVGGENKTLVDLAYGYTRVNTTTGRTGQLTRVINHLETTGTKDRNYAYDALGRLVEAAGGSVVQPTWRQRYSYDRYGNRTGVTAEGSETAPSTTTAPGGLTATAAAGGAQVNLTWSAASGAVSHYQVERRGRVTDAYTVVGTTTETSFTDAGVTSGAAYLYRVRAVEAAGTLSAGSNVELVTALAFTDETLTSGVTRVKAQHLTELRQAVNAVRATANLPAAGWTDATLQGAVIRAVHVTELRARVDEALGAMGLTTPAYTDATVAGVGIKRVHIAELRERVNWGGGSDVGVPQSTPIPRDGHATLSYDATTNRINSAGWEYDAAGNQTRTQTASGGWQRMEYDAANRMTRVTNDARTQTLTAYTYGVGNQRLASSDGSQTRTLYVWGAGGVTAEYTDTGALSWTKSYIYMGGRLLSTISPVSGTTTERVEFHHPDRLGTRLITAAGTTDVVAQEMLPFGTEIGNSGSSTTRRFTSYDRNQAVGLDYAVNRHYDPMQGRFSQVDPIGLSASSLLDPQSLNMYAYVGNDPINRTDPDGLFWGWLKRVLKRVLKAVLFAAVTVAIGYLTGGVGGWAAAAKLFGTSFLSAIGGQGFKASIGRGTPPTFPTTSVTLNQVLRQIPTVNRVLGDPRQYLTAGFNPNASSFAPQTGGQPSSDGYPCPPSIADIFFGKRSGAQQVVNTLGATWERARRNNREEGGWIYMNKRGRIKAVEKIRGKGDSQTAIVLAEPPRLKGWIVVANFHTHDFESSPSLSVPGFVTGDTDLNTYRDQIPGIILGGTNGSSTAAFTPYGPERGFFQSGLPRRCQK
jgi:RHS repeat-associated protein